MIGPEPKLENLASDHITWILTIILFISSKSRNTVHIAGNCREHVWRTHYNIYLYKCNKSPGCHRKFRLVCNFVVLDTRTMLVSV